MCSEFPTPSSPSSPSPLPSVQSEVHALVLAAPPAPLTAPPAPASPPPQCKEWGSTEKQEQKYYPSSTIHYHTLHHSAHLPKNLERGSTGATRTQVRGKENQGGSPASSTSCTTNGSKLRSKLRRRILISLFTDGAVTGFPLPVPASMQGQEQEKMEKVLKEMQEAIWQLRISQAAVNAPVPSQGLEVALPSSALPAVVSTENEKERGKEKEKQWRRRNQHLSPLHLP
ncbi:hypothetical protein BDZ91DRAFT_800027 [Kalaharituber pfeilii]|nr:hypothetical protein BDZ91DRAFT_800027 [Kalaharituber pfeilii]